MPTAGFAHQPDLKYRYIPYLSEKDLNPFAALNSLSISSTKYKKYFYHFSNAFLYYFLF